MARPPCRLPVPSRRCRGEAGAGHAARPTGRGGGHAAMPLHATRQTQADEVAGVGRGQDQQGAPRRSGIPPPRGGGRALPTDVHRSRYPPRGRPSRTTSPPAPPARSDAARRLCGRTPPPLRPRDAWHEPDGTAQQPQAILLARASNGQRSRGSPTRPRSRRYGPSNASLPAPRGPTAHDIRALHIESPPTDGAASGPPREQDRVKSSWDIADRRTETATRVSTSSSDHDLGHPRYRLHSHPSDHTTRRNQCHIRNCSPPRRNSATRRSS